MSNHCGDGAIETPLHVLCKEELKMLLSGESAVNLKGSEALQVQAELNSHEPSGKRAVA